VRTQPARGRTRRARPVGYAWTLLGVALLSLLAMSYVSETAAATRASYRIDALKQEQSRLIAEQQQTRYQISMAASADRLDGDAGRLGMVRPTQLEYMRGAGSPVALLRNDPEPGARESHTWLDQLAVAFGRPTDAQARGR
jgi:hypothetical protein